MYPSDPTAKFLETVAQYRVVLSAEEFYMARVLAILDQVATCPRSAATIEASPLPELGRAWAEIVRRAHTLRRLGTKVA
jgi:hypothetical protein